MSMNYLVTCELTADEFNRIFQIADISPTVMGKFEQENDGEVTDVFCYKFLDGYKAKITAYPGSGGDEGYINVNLINPNGNVVEASEWSSSIFIDEGSNKVPKITMCSKKSNYTIEFKRKLEPDISHDIECSSIYALYEAIQDENKGAALKLFSDTIGKYMFGVPANASITVTTK